MTVGLRFTFADLLRAHAAAAELRQMQDEAQRLADELTQRTGVADYLEIVSGDVFDVEPEGALAYFRQKGLRTTFSYADMIGAAHDHAFTVAKMMDVDLLGQVRASLDSALANGTAFSEWKRTITPILKSAGWWGEADVVDPATGATTRAQLGSAWRLETIFRTNMQAAYAVGQWREIELQADAAPFLMYDAVDDLRTRAQHRRWDRTVLPVTAQWWRTHYPPNGYNCRCGVIQMDEEQLREFGLSPGEPPADGTYKWRNPRTGDTVRVPDGIDPGFDRNPGQAQVEQLRQLLKEKIEALPQDMQGPAKQAMRRQFDQIHEAGRWHAQSFDAAPDWLRTLVLDQQYVDVQTLAKQGAWAQLGKLVEMDGYLKTEARGQSVWRHEFGHIVDVRLGHGAGFLYRSQSNDFQAAMRQDADAHVVAAGHGRKSKANDARRAAVVKAYADARERIIDQEGRLQRIRELRKMAEAIDVDFDGFLAVLRTSTKILEADTEGGIGNAVRIARMLEAIRLGDGEGFLRFAAFMDSFDEAVAATANQVLTEQMRASVRDARMLMGESWRKDGALASLADLIGASSKNKAASYNRGFPGHSDAYYKRAEAPGTESFANLTALAGHPAAAWWVIARRLFPNLADVYERIVKEAAK